MADNVVRFQKPSRPATKGCMNCKFRTGTDTIFWKCGVTSTYCSIESVFPTGCGLSKQFWEPRPPSFWHRLGDVIIDRIRKR